MKKAFIALSFGTFGLGVAEFSMMAILPYVAADLHVSIPTAGSLISPTRPASAWALLPWSSCATGP